MSLDSGFVDVNYIPEIASDLLQSVQFAIRTRKPAGVLFHMEGTDDSCFMNAQLSEVKTLLNYQFGNTEDVVNEELDVSLADGSEHVVSISLKGPNSIVVNVDGNEIFTKTSAYTSAPTLGCIASSAILIGGTGGLNLDNQQTPQVANPQPGVDGCFTNFRINDLFVPLQSDFGSNLKFSFVESAAVELGCDSDACENGDICQNGGTCVDVWRAFECDCDAGKLLKSCFTLRFRLDKNAKI